MKNTDGRLFAFEKLFWGETVLLGFIKLFQIGEIILEESGSFYEHEQVCHEITYITSGEGVFYSDGTAIPVKSGELHVISKGKKHAIKGGNNGKLRYICIGFDFFNITEKFKPIACFYENSPYVAAKSEADTRHLFDMLINEFYFNSAPEKLVIEYILKLILIQVSECFKKEAIVKSKKKRAVYGEATVYKIKKYIDSKLYTVKSVREIAAALNFTENYVSHIFKANTGISLSSYIKKRKLDVAAALLLNRNMTLTEIAEILNFDSVQTLSRAFKQEFGKAPTRFIIASQNNGA